MLSSLGTQNSPFTADQLAALQQSIGALDPAQSQWLSGYLVGRLAADNALAPSEQVDAGQSLDIIYGSETGNGEQLANRLAESLQQAGVSTRIKDLDEFRSTGLKKLQQAVFIVSTHGEGDPPEQAAGLFEYLDGPRAPSLSGLRYRVLALGDRSYEHFCAAGRQLDERLEALGGERFGARVDCDVDYGSGYEAWASEVIGWSQKQLQATPVAPSARLSLVPPAPSWSREHPYAAPLIESRRITSAESGKEVHHLELDLAGSGLNYAPGDALGVWAPNDPQVVDAIIGILGIESSETVDARNPEQTIAQALIEELEITRLSSDTITDYARQAGRQDLLEYYETLDPADRQLFIKSRQLIDVVEQWPGSLSASELAGLLRPLGPRSYSIASSQAAVDEEVHLTVATLSSQSGDQKRFGQASHFLNQRLETDARVRVFLEPNRRFRLPEDLQAPIIMIGAGTGIAPYRAFMQELELRDERPDSWLIFGNPHQRSDFLYQREWLKWRSKGLLTHIDAAWSRDQPDKRYVQHIVQEQAQRLHQWVERGAYIYLCGALSMGQSVADTICEVLAEQNQWPLEKGRDAVANLRREKRLLKDLY